MNDENKRLQILSNLIKGLLLFQGASGVYGGTALVLDPSGHFLGMPPGLLDGSPFSSYLVPGSILLTVLGIFPLVVWQGIRREKSWSWTGALAVSVALILWIGIQIAMVGYQPDPPLQLVYGSAGLVLLILVLAPTFRNNYA